MSNGLIWLQHNPWASAAWLNQVMPERKVRALTASEEVEAIQVKGATRGRPVHLYRVRPEAALRHGLACLTPNFSARLALMSIGRLRRSRYEIVRMIPAGYEMVWMVSPVVVGREMYPFDAMTALRKGNKVLAVVWLFPPKSADLAFYTYTARRWLDLQEVLQTSMLLMIKLPGALSPSLQRFLLMQYGGKSVTFLGQNTSVTQRWGVELLGERQSENLRALLGYKPSASRCVSSSIKVQAKQAWQQDSPRRDLWLKLIYPFVADEDAITPRMLQIVALITRYPGLPLDVLAHLANANENDIRKVMRRLTAMRLVGSPESTVATDFTRSLLAALQGVPLEVLEKYKYMGSAGAVKGKEAHTQTIYRFFNRLQDHGVLLTFAAEPPAFRFVQRGKVFTVAPDGIGILFSRRWSPPRFREFWLEVDRGTLSRQRLEQKIGRLFLAAQAGFSDVPFRVQAMAFLVDMDDATRAENRVQLIRRLLQKAYERHRVALTVAVGRWDWLQHQNIAWRVFRAGKWHAHRVDLPEALLAPVSRRISA